MSKEIVEKTLEELFNRKQLLDVGGSIEAFMAEYPEYDARKIKDSGEKE